LIDLEIATFDVDIRLCRSQELGGAGFIEDDNGIDSFESGEHDGAVGLGIQRPSGTLQLADRFVGIESDEQEIALGASGFEVGDVAGVQDVKATVGDDQFSAVGADAGAPGIEAIAGDDFPEAVHIGIVGAGVARRNRIRELESRAGCYVSRTCVLGGVAYTCGMKRDVVPVQIRGILPANSGCAIFVGNDEKVFVIQVEHNMGVVIGKFLRQAPSERPLTHDLIVNIFEGFNISVDRVVITELRNSTYFARLILHQQNELGRKIVEIDARPSDCIAIATAHKKPIFVAGALFEQVDDMSELLERINENGGDAVA
jgi:bifunctional DNase/RNase